MKRPFAVLRTRGAKWDETRAMEAQNDWPAHASFMNALAAERFVRVGGPLGGTPDVLLVIEAEDPREITDRLSADPWTQSGHLIVKACWPWDIRLGSLSP